MQNAINKSNIIWVDYVKFIGIFLVICMHTLGMLSLLDIGIYKHINGIVNLFYMPMFFVLAGYLYKDKGKSENYKKILWALLIPYLLYQFLYLPFKLCTQIFLHHLPIVDTVLKDFLGILLGDVQRYEENSFFYSVCNPCYFIMVMIQIRFLFANIKITLKNSIILSVLSFVILQILVRKDIDLYFCLDNTLYAIPFFIIGYWIKYIKDNHIKETVQEFFKNNIVLISISALMTVILLLLYKINGFVIFARVTYSITGHSVSLAYISAILGTAVIIFLSNLFKKENAFVKTIGRNTLFIIYYHYWLIWVFKMLKFHKINISDGGKTFIVYCILCLINLIICYFTIKFAEKYCPMLLGKGLHKK